MGWIDIPSDRFFWGGFLPYFSVYVWFRALSCSFVLYTMNMSIEYMLLYIGLELYGIL